MLYSDRHDRSFLHCTIPLYAPFHQGERLRNHPYVLLRFERKLCAVSHCLAWHARRSLDLNHEHYIFVVLPIRRRTTPAHRIIWGRFTTIYSAAVCLPSDCSIFQHHPSACQKCVCFRLSAYSIYVSDRGNLDAPYDYDLFRLKTFAILCLLLVLLRVWFDRLPQFPIVLQDVQALLR